MSRPAVFLDRDGTLNQDTGYLSSPSDVVLIDGVPDALARLETAGYARVIVTNQSGIGRGLIAPLDFDAVQAELTRQLTLGGAAVEASFHCPHLPDAGCACRKPGTALHREAAARLDLELASSWCVGDRISDVTAAAGFGGRAILVLTGHGGQHAQAAGDLGIPVAADLRAAVELILAAKPEQ